MTAESCIDVQDFRFKSAAKTKVFNGAWPDVSSQLALIATASRCGLAFAGTPNGFKVYELKSLVEAGESNANVPCREVSVDGSLKMLHINCDDTLLAVVLGAHDGQPRALIYQVSDFLTASSLTPSGHIVLASGGGQTVADFAWNPVNPGTFCVCLSDGQVSSFEVKGPSTIGLINTVAAGAACVAWSPKGKQLVAATRDGRLSQFMPDLRPVKTVGPPEGLGPSPEAVSVVWLSSFQFGVVFRLGGADDQRLSLCVVNTPKNGPVTAQDFDDVCYSSGDLRQNQFYLNMVSQWGVLLVASANGAEVGLLGQKEAPVWQQWTLEDSARAELPLDNCADTFPLGMAFCTTAICQLMWEEAQLPHMPILLLLSHCGTLCAFHALNLKPGATEICQLAEAQPLPGLFTASTPAAAPSPVVQKAPEPMKEQPKPQPSISFGQVSAAQPSMTTPPKMFYDQLSATQATSAATFSVSLQVTSQPPASAPVKPSAASTALYTVPPPALDLTSKEPPPVQPALEVKVVKEVVPEQAMSEEAFLAASSAIMRQFKEEIATSLKQSTDRDFTVGSRTDSDVIASTLNSAEEKLIELQQLSNNFSQQMNDLNNANLKSIRKFEEIRTRHEQRADPGYIQAARTRPLDPTTQALKQEIATRMQYIESQTSQAMTMMNLALDATPFKPSSNMALHQTLIMQRKCIANLNARLDSMEAKAGLHAPSLLDLSSLSAALPNVANKPEPTLSREQELLLSSFLKDRPISLVKRKLPTPAPSPVKPVSPLRPISPLKFEPREAKAQPLLAPKSQTVAQAAPLEVKLNYNLSPALTITRVSQAAAQPTVSNSFVKADVAKPAVIAASNPPAAFSFSSTPKPFSFTSESKPSEFLFGAKDPKPSGVAAPVELVNKTPSKLDVEVVATDGGLDEKQKVVEIKGKEQTGQESITLTSILQSSPTAPPKTGTSKFSQPLLATPTTISAASSVFSTPILAPKPAFFSGGNLFSSNPASSTPATNATVSPKFSFPSFTSSTSTSSTFAFGTAGKASIFGSISSLASEPAALATTIEPAPVTTTTATTIAAFSAMPATTTSSFGFGTQSTKASVGSAPDVTTSTEAPPASTTTSSAPSLFSLLSTPVAKAESTTSAAVADLFSSIPTPTTTAATASPTAAKITVAPFAAASLFGSAQTATTTAASATSVFGSSQTATTTAASVTAGFGSASVFGSNTTAATPVFGSATTASTPAFGTTTTSSAPVFGATPSSSAPVFGSTTTTSTPSFGGTTTSSAPAFGTATTSSTPVFGATTTTTTSSTSVFGATTTSSAPVFGAAASTAASSFSFATAAAGSTDQVTNLFGGMGSGGSLFGGGTSFTSSPKPAASIFGGTATPSASEQNPFGGMQACSPSTTKNLFGQSQPQANPFSTPKAATPAATNLFGQSPASTPANASGSSFGQSGGSLFGQSFTPSKSIFGGGNLILYIL
ncbi:Hypothetical predicted protein [Cloeon dipterum]|uniref:Nucleoporin Nup159/Nup146 N-terminal domain-containing protein n=1 Tax=Cloeon dipterum TaxID=197152 RepID=A0A8S1CEX9_9INSE|nr:Hypothetical predicted protein [Cloeon dipterum]